MVRMAPASAVCVARVRFWGQTIDTPTESAVNAVCRSSLVMSNSRLFSAEVVPVTLRLVPISLLLGQMSGTDVALLMEETATTSPTTYSDCRLMVGVHRPGVTTTNVTSASAGTELTL